MNIKDKIKVKRIYLKKKKELLLKLKENIELLDLSSPNGYFLSLSDLKMNAIKGYISNDIAKEEIEYLKELAIKDGIEFNIKYSPYRPYELIATTKYINNNIGSFKVRRLNKGITYTSI